MPAISDAQALAILRDSTNKTYDAQGKAANAAMGSQVAAKSSAAKAAADGMKGDQMSSVTKLASSGMGMLLNTKLNVAANRGPTAAEKLLSPDESSRNNAKKAGMNSATQSNSVGQLVTSMGDAADQAVGGAHQSAQAKIDGKFADMAETIASQQAEAAKTNRDKAFKAVDSTEDFAKGFIDRAKAVVDKMFGG